MHHWGLHRRSGVVVNTIFRYHIYCLFKSIFPSSEGWDIRKRGNNRKSRHSFWSGGLRYLRMHALGVEEHFTHSLSPFLLFFVPVNVFKIFLELISCLDYWLTRLKFRTKEKIHNKDVANVSRGIEGRVLKVALSERRREMI